MTQTKPECIAANRCFGGWHQRYRHRAETLNCDMTYAVYRPPQAENGPVPLMWWLSGLTCTDENFMQKAGAFNAAAQLGMAIVCPDTSPRGTDLPGEHERYDFGSGAGFYLNATQSPYAAHYQMYDYITDELPALIQATQPVDGRQSISGHSMGGHGALVCALRNPGRYAAVSAFAPICNPSECAWGQTAFSGYLGDDRQTWQAWDAVELIKRQGSALEILVDQGEADGFLADGQLRPEALELACNQAGVALTLRRQAHYDHSYFFIASFIGEHLQYHRTQIG